MLDNFTYQQKNIGLLVLFVVFSYLAYTLALKETIDLAGDCSVLEEKIRQVKTAPERIAELKAELSAIEKVVGKDAADGIDFQQLLLEKVSGYCNKNQLVLKEFPQSRMNDEQDFIVETGKVVVAGSFKKLLQLLFELEQRQPIGKIAGVHFLTNKNLKTKTTELTSSIYVQHIQKKKNQ